MQLGKTAGAPLLRGAPGPACLLTASSITQGCARFTSGLPCLSHHWHGVQLRGLGGLGSRHPLCTIHTVQSRRSQQQVAAQPSLATGTVVRAPGMEDIRWGSALSRDPDLADAVEEAVKSIMASIGKDAQPEIALVFASSLHGPDFDTVVPLLRQRVPSLRTIFGCSGYGVAGGSEQGPVEVEGEHAFSLTLGQLPGTTVKVLHTLRSSIPAEDASPEDWAQFVGVPHDSVKPTSFIIFADPRFAQVRDIVAGLDYAFPDSPKIGSILSSGTRSKSRAMWAWSQSGAVGTGRQGAGAASVSRRKGGPQGAGLRGQRGRGSSGGALFSNEEQRMAAAVMAVMKPSPVDGSPASLSSQLPGSSKDAADNAPPDVTVIGSRDAAGKNNSSSEGRKGGADSRKDSKGKPGGLLDSFMGLLKSRKQGQPRQGKSTASGSEAGSGSSNTEASSTSSQSVLGSNLNLNLGTAQEVFQNILSAAAGTGDSEASTSQTSTSASSTSSLMAADVPNNGMYMYGAVVLALQGDVQLDVLTSTGYRAPSPRVWRITTMSNSNTIEGILPEEVAVELGDKPGKRKGTSTRGRVISSVFDSDDDSDDDSDNEEESAVMPALSAVVDVLDCLTSQEEGLDMVMGRWKELMDTAVVAVAADNSKPASELGPSDWELLPLEDIFDEYGVLVVGDPATVGGGVDLRPGNRMRIMIRDPEGVKSDLRSCLLAYKRRDLTSMLEGRQMPPTFGGLLFTDVDRGMDCYQEPHFESRTTHAYVPAPISGLFGGAQMGPLHSAGSGTAILEYAAVVGVLRAATDRSNASIKQEAQQRRESAQQAAEELAAQQRGSHQAQEGQQARGTAGSGSRDKQQDAGSTDNEGSA